MTEKEALQLANMIPPELTMAAEFFTVVTSLIGMVLTLVLTLFFSRDERRLSQNLKHEYFSHFLLYVVTLVMGLGLYFDALLVVKVDVIIRPFVICLNIYAMIRLYRHYRRM